jgi:hypothetical protein
MLYREPISRREWLARGAHAVAGLAAAAALKSTSLAADAPIGKPAALMRFGFTTYEWGKPWDIPTLIANCAKAGALGAELRTSAGYAHGVETTIAADRRREVRKQFADSTVTLVGLASGERFDSPDAGELKSAIEGAKRHLQLSHDLGASGVRVFPNDYHKDVPRERTIEQIARALNVVGAAAADLNQQVRLEAHGSAGDLASMRSIMEQVTQRSVRVKLNSDRRDAAGQGFEHQFSLVKEFLGDTLHAHDFKDEKFPYQLQTDLLVKMGWAGWVLLESSEKVADRVAALQEQREIFERMRAKAVAAKAAG